MAEQVRWRFREEREQHGEHDRKQNHDLRRGGVVEDSSRDVHQKHPRVRRQSEERDQRSADSVLRYLRDIQWNQREGTAGGESRQKATEEQPFHRWGEDCDQPPKLEGKFGSENLKL